MKDILTETEAKTRWCPMARAVSTINVESKTRQDVEMIAANRVATEFPLCIAGECMAWRLSHKDGPNGEETGYCGAFGTPRFT